MKRDLITFSVTQLKREGWASWRVKPMKENSEQGRRLFGFGDILAVHPLRHITEGIVVCDIGSLAKVKNKTMETSGAIAWLRSGNKILIHAYGVKNSRGDRYLEIREVGGDWLNLKETSNGKKRSLL